MSDLSWRPDLHVRLARREALLTRATRAAAASAAAAIIGWLLGLGPGAHALAVLAAAVVAAAWPLRPSLLAAFQAIAQQAGLAYQTHIEHHGRDDPHGLLAAAAVQARLSIRGVTPPQQGAWWLPLAALAVAIWLLASVVGGPGSWFASTEGAAPELGQTAPHASPPTPPPPGALDPEAEDEPDAEEAAPPEPAAEAPEPSRPDDGPAGSGDDGTLESDAEGLEREALDRFLESLRERPQQSEQEAAAAEAERDGVRDDADADLGEAELQRQAEQGDALEDGQLSPADRADEDADGDESFEYSDGSDPGDGEADGFEEVAFGEDPGDGEGFAEGEGDEGDGQEGFEASDEGVPQPESAGDESGAPSLGDDEQGLDAGTGDDAGIGAGAPDQGHDAIPDAAGDLEALPGILGSGPESLGGRVRLPGRDSEVELQGGDVARYERAVEQAVTDGSVPVTYQEIIRNYFR